MNKQIVLTAVHGDLAGQRFVFEGRKRWLLGRAPNCSLRLLSDAMVSRQHCVLDIDTPAAWVQDLGSLNGTYLNGRNIGASGAKQEVAGATMQLPEAKPLGDGDELRVGRNVFRVRVVEAERAEESGSSEYEAHTVCC